MNQIFNQLTPMDFGRPLDNALFDRWKASVAAQAAAGRTTMILFFVGLGLLLLLGGLVGLLCFFTLAIIGLCIAAPKKKAMRAYQCQLGITDDELKRVIAQKRAQARGA